ncbi:MAG: hypothetical protein QME16_01870 [Planctomycetota bacterium]|nr:hypothetical protein [Planctomycetota bacterium]
MEKIVRFIICLILFLLPFSNLLSEIVILKDGSKYIGSLQEEGQVIKIATPPPKQTTIAVNKDDIKVIYSDINAIVDKIRVTIKKADEIVDRATKSEDLDNRNKEIEKGLEILKEAQSIAIETAEFFTGENQKVFNEVMSEINQAMKYARSLMVTKPKPLPSSDTSDDEKKGEIKKYPCLYCYGSTDLLCADCEGTGKQLLKCDICSGKGECKYCRGTTKVVCSTCGGSGEETYIGGPQGFHTKTCRTCKGNKHIKCRKCKDLPGRCHFCAGKGTVLGKKCAVCEGNGLVSCKTCKGDGFFPETVILGKPFDDVLNELNKTIKSLDGVKDDVKYSLRRKMNEIWEKEFAGKIVQATGVLEKIYLITKPDDSHSLILQIGFRSETTLFFCGANLIDYPSNKLASIGKRPLYHLQFATTPNWLDKISEVTIGDKVWFLMMLPSQIRQPLLSLSDIISDDIEFNKILLLTYQPAGGQKVVTITPPLKR